MPRRVVIDCLLFTFETGVFIIDICLTNDNKKGRAIMHGHLGVATSYPRRERSPNYFRRVEA